MASLGQYNVYCNALQTTIYKVFHKCRWVFLYYLALYCGDTVAVFSTLPLYGWPKLKSNEYNIDYFWNHPVCSEYIGRIIIVCRCSNDGHYPGCDTQCLWKLKWEIGIGKISDFGKDWWKRESLCTWNIRKRDKKYVRGKFWELWFCCIKIPS